MLPIIHCCIHYCFNPVCHLTVDAKAKRYATAVIGATTEHDVVDECSIPRYDKSVTFDIPVCNNSMGEKLGGYKHLFRSVPGATNLAYHHIPTTGNPVRVPPQQIPGHYKQDVERQICDMLHQGIIEESCNPWMAPAVFVRKKSGDICLCVDYHELNKKT